MLSATGGWSEQPVAVQAAPAAMGQELTLAFTGAAKGIADSVAKAAATVAAMQPGEPDPGPPTLAFQITASSSSNEKETGAFMIGGGPVLGGPSPTKGLRMHTTGPVPFSNLLYHLDATPGKFMAKVSLSECGCVSR